MGEFYCLKLSDKTSATNLKYIVNTLEHILKTAE